MTASFGASPRPTHAAPAPLSRFQTNTLEMALLAVRVEQANELTHHAATLAKLMDNSTGDTTGRDRAMAALHMYGAREAIEEVEDALLRIRDGGYGTCQSCGQPISFARLEVFPGARCCIACSPASTRASRAEKTHGIGQELNR
jgi:RNA polymerase-binding transcription factor DksA